MKKRNLLLMLILAIAITSCNNGGNNKTSESGPEGNEITKILAEKALNESIQNVFFGVPFGATFEEACEKLSQDFWPIKELSTKDRLSLTPIRGGRISFGGMSWSELNVGFSNNRFYLLQLCNAHKTKEAAISNFNNLYSVISQKYNMITIPTNDTTLYGSASGITKTNQTVSVYCRSYESVGHERWIGVYLEYTDLNFQGISEEL